MNTLLIVTGLLCSITLNFAEGRQSSCATPKGIPGTCMQLPDCKLAVDLLSKPSDTNRELLTDIIFLSDCGLFSTNICCPNGSETTTTTERPRQHSYETRPWIPSKTESLLPEKCGYPSFGTSIMYGENAKVNEFPWIARLERKKYEGLEGKYGKVVCGGVLINKRYVLTAAHCSDNHDLVKEANVVLGLTSAADIDPSAFTIQIESVAIHEKYEQDAWTPTHDVSLLRLSRDVKFTNNVHPICMPKKGYSVPRDAILEIAGWGVTEADDVSLELKKAEISLVGRYECSRKYSGMHKILSSMICAAGKNNEDTCSGDSGGPLMVRNSYGIYTVAGIVSFGYGCGDPDYPGVYTDVEVFLPWIMQNMKP